MSVAVVLLSKDEPSLAESLDLLRPQCESMAARCLVIDASEGRLDHIRVANPWVAWVDYVKPFWRKSSIPHQRNIGVRQADTDIVAFCDAGGRPAGDWLRNITAPLVAGTYQYVSGPIVPSEAGSFETFNPSPTGTITINAPTANVAFTREVFNQVGGFDERYNYGSDNDLLLRFRNQGIDCFVIHEAVMEMPWGNIGLNLRRAWRWGRGSGTIVRYHRDQRWTWLKTHPAALFWNVMILVMLGTMVTLLSRRTPFVVLPWVSLTGFWLLKNRNTPRLDRVAIDHLIQTLAFDFELASAVIPRGARIAIVCAESTCSETLMNACREVGNPAVSVNPRNVFRLAWLRCRGLRLVVLVGPPMSSSRWVMLVGALLRMAVHEVPQPQLDASATGAGEADALRWARELNVTAMRMRA
ncbi:unannotated protein [freshwater metagenome]|uniref:Unannotated protein n=1 Tax=freshwater metagenome TaxID=449393 RepID=A0A6J7CQT1_9ZZZZ